MDFFETDLIQQAYRVLETERFLQKMSLNDVDLRRGTWPRSQSAYRNKVKYQVDMQLSTLAKIAHTMGKRIVLSVEDEVKE